MSKVKKYFAIAAKIALLGDSKEAERQYRIGAIGIRNDGVMVCSSNISARTPNRNAHAEARVSKKLNTNSVVFVVRVDRSGGFRMARPCSNCMQKLKRTKVKKCYYSINDKEYGVIMF
jgi:cytidine deaminase